MTADPQVKLHFVSKAGSRVTVSGKHMGISHIEFDWVEEPGACIEMNPSFNHDLGAPDIVASCACHGTIYIPLKRKEEND